MEPGSRVYTFFSVHERLFLPVHRLLRDRYGVEGFAGTVWGQDQASFLGQGDIAYDPLLVFTRDVLEPSEGAVPDIDFLRQREELYGVPIHRMIWSERHLLKGRGYKEVLALTEQIFRVVEDAFDRFQPSFLFSEDVGCLTSYVHYAVARGRGIPFWRVGSARMPGLLSVYSGGPQEWNLTKDKLAEIRQRGLSAQERSDAESFVQGFRDRPERPTGIRTRARLPVVEKEDVERLAQLGKRYITDPHNPTLTSPVRALGQRAARLPATGPRSRSTTSIVQ